LNSATKLGADRYAEPIERFSVALAIYDGILGRGASTFAVKSSELMVIYQWRRKLHYQSTNMSSFYRLPATSQMKLDTLRPVGYHAESFALPFARRRASTLRPPLDDILLRKPCSFDRCLFFG